MKSIRHTAITLALSLFSYAFAAESIKLGQSLPLTGPLAEIGREYRDGALAYFKQINQLGGVHGRPIELISLDDNYDVDRSKANTQKFIAEERVVALFGPIGTANIDAIRPMIDKHDLPTIAPLSGSDELRKFNRNIFWLRGSYGDETEKIVEQLITTGIKRIAVFYQNNPFGLAGLKGVENALRIRNLEIVAKGSFETNSSKVAPAAQAIGAAAPQAVIMISANRPTAMFVKEIKARGEHPLLFGISVVGLKALLEELGPDAVGIAVSQVVPSPTNTSHRLVREFNKLPHNLQPASGLTYTSLEGYLAAKVVTEALKRAGPAVTRTKLVNALESMSGYDAGGVQIKFSPTNHNGSQFGELVIIGRDGKIIQ